MGALDGRHQGGGRLAHPEGREARGQVGGLPVGAQAVDLGLVLGQEEEAARAVLDGLAEGLLVMLPAAEDDPAGDVEATVVLTQPVGKPVHAPRGAAAAGVAAPDVGVIPAEGEVADVRRPPGAHGLHAEVHQACLGHQEEGQEAEEGAAAQAVEAQAVHQGAHSSVCSAGRQEGKARSAPGAAGQAAMASASVSATTRVPSGRGPSRSVSAM